MTEVLRGTKKIKIKIKDEKINCPKKTDVFKKDEVYWECDDHSWTVEFEAGCPLEGGPIFGDKLKPGGVVSDEAEGDYKYSVFVDTYRPLDPELIVKP